MVSDTNKAHLKNFQLYRYLEYPWLLNKIVWNLQKRFSEHFVVPALGGYGIW